MTNQQLPVLCPTISVTFPNKTIRHSHPPHASLGRACGGERVTRFWTSSFFFHFFSPHPLFMWTAKYNWLKICRFFSQFKPLFIFYFGSLFNQPARMAVVNLIYFHWFENLVEQHFSLLLLFYLNPTLMLLGLNGTKSLQPGARFTKCSTCQLRLATWDHIFSLIATRSMNKNSLYIFDSCMSLREACKTCDLQCAKRLTDTTRDLKCMWEKCLVHFSVNGRVEGWELGQEVSVCVCVVLRQWVGSGLLCKLILSLHISNCAALMRS